MDATGHQVIGVIEVSGRSAPADLRPPRRRSKAASSARRQPEVLDCEMIPADLRQLRRDLRHELAKLLARLGAGPSV